jgi:tetratricopeptide (TPR) repeat protein
VTVNDGVPVPKVIDFGIAKATAGRLTDHTLFTAFEQFIGTPAYMSPEQAELSGIDIDTRSDIYSLGVLLYELLTGRLPFDPKSLLQSGIDEIRRIIREVEPPRPSTNLSTLGDSDRAQVARVRSTDAEKLSLLLRGDLDWIVMRCLEKNRARRYETPDALAADIARHLHDEPVIARPPSRAYRLERLIRRNRMEFAAAGAVVLALLAGFVISTWQAVRATRAERLADQERAEAVGERTRAEGLLKFMLGDLYTQLDGLGRLDVLDSVADKAASYFASLGPGDLSETTQLSRARSLWLLGEVRMAQARYADAEAAFTEAHARASELAARHPRDGEVLFERGQAEFALGLVHWKRSELAGAADWFTRYHDTSTALVALDPSRSDWQLEVADAQYNLAMLTKERGDAAAARSEFLAELANLGRLVAADPGNLDVRDREAEAHYWLGSIAELQGDLPEAAKQYTTQASLLDSIAKADTKTASRRQLLATALLYVATIDSVTGEYAAAAEALARARGLLDDLVALDPENVAWRSLSLNAGLAEASLARRRGDFAAARRLVEKSLPGLESISKGEPTDRYFAGLVLKAWRMKAQLQLLWGEAEAGASARHAAEMGEKLSGSAEATAAELGESVRALLVLGQASADSGDPAAARGDWSRAAELIAPRVGGTREWRILDPYARAMSLLGRTAEANDAIRRLNQLGYVPLEPWPDVGRSDGARLPDPQQK